MFGMHQCLASKVAILYILKSKSQYGQFLGGLSIEDVGIFYGPFVAIWYILWSFGTFFLVGMLYQEKS
jgi:hypothetical protein